MTDHRFRLAFTLLAALATHLIRLTAVKADTISFSDLLNRPAPVATKQLAYGTDPNQFGELWLPDGPGPFPVLVMIHGGCWLAALPGVVLMAYIAEDMRKSGVAVWNVEYRRLGSEGAGYPGTFLDIANAIDDLRKIGPANHLDLSNVVVTGHSAGGHLALWAAARPRLKRDSALYRADPLPIRTAVTLAGINDLSAYRDKGPSACGGPGTIDQLVGAEARSGQDLYIDTSPAAMLPLKVEQLIVSGTLDPIVPSRFGRDYGTLAKAAGDPAVTMDLEGAGHFELIDPQSAAWAVIKASLMGYTHLK